MYCAILRSRNYSAQSRDSKNAQHNLENSQIVRNIYLGQAGRKLVIHTILLLYCIAIYIYVCMCVYVYIPGKNPSQTSSWCPGVTVVLLPANMTWLTVSVSPSICCDFYQLLGEGCVKGTAVMLLPLPVRKVTTRS